MIWWMLAIWSLPFLNPAWTSGSSRFTYCWSLAWRILSITLLACAAAAKPIQSCATLCNPIDGSPPGSPIPGILQARILEWVAIAFSAKTELTLQHHFMTHKWEAIERGFGEGNGNPLQYSCLENPVDRGAWWAAVHRVTQSWTRLNQLSMHACLGEGNGNPLQCSCLENPMDRGAWWAAVCGVAQSRTQKRLSSSSSSSSWRQYYLELLVEKERDPSQTYSSKKIISYVF